MKHLLLFPTWIMASIILTLIALAVHLFRWEFKHALYRDIWSYKEFVRISTNKAKAEL